MDQLKLQAQGIPLPNSPAYRTFTPTVVALLAAILTLFCVFVEYEEPQASQAQISQYYKWLIDVEVRCQLSDINCCSRLVCSSAAESTYHV
jgi:hypothetical protein